ncbi:hypothetical protein CsSME_00049148 [Camellia sinensis var. sinensis]
MEEMFEKCAPLINLGNEIAVILKTQPLSSLLVIGCNQLYQTGLICLIAGLAVQTVTGLVALASHDKIAKLWK